MYESSIRRWEAALLISMCTILCAAAWAQARQSSVTSSLVRLHVIAHSDDEYEQELKLRVRDAVLSSISPALTKASSPEEAQAIISAHLSEIADAALSASEGRVIKVTLGREHYPTRVYEYFTLPAGTYQSLRVIIGEGKGRNWWCIVFPPVCLDAVSNEKLRSVMSRDDLNLIDGDGYELRFRIIELWESIRQRAEKTE